MMRPIVLDDSKIINMCTPGGTRTHSLLTNIAVFEIFKDSHKNSSGVMLTSISYFSQKSTCMQINYNRI